ncbi:Maf-like protein, partial [Dipodascopsis tothii]|uniref:Maf-like protein n=1 Tax=Dipodascopsis tothii TaxID=44089 RepID=UPI0034CFC51F
MSVPPSYDDALMTPTALKLPIFQHLQQRRVVLASASPRRAALLRQIGMSKFEIKVSGFEENLDKHAMDPYEYVTETATQKALAVYKLEAETDNEDVGLIIAADTIVVAQNRVLEKPKSAGEHFKMLQTLRDDDFPHRVFTAVVCIAPLEEPVYPGYNLQTHIEETQVFFDKEVSDDFLRAYVACGEGRDAAGGYQIQSRGALLVNRIAGDYTNVVGLPVKALVKLMEKTVFPEEKDYEE